MRRRSFKAEFLSNAEKTPKTKLIAVRLPEELEEKLKELAKAKGISFSRTLIEALKYALEEEDDGKK